MGFFSSDTDVDYYPPKTAKGTSAGQARNYLNNLLGESQGMQYPTRQVAGLSANEQAGQGILGNILSGQSFQDPASSSLYAGLRGAMQSEEQDAVSALRHRQNLGGMFRSSPGGRQEADLRGDFANQRLNILGGLYERERNRDNPYTRLAAASQYGGLPRTIEQSQADADYAQQIQTLLGPLQHLAPLAQQMIGNEVWFGPTVTSQPSQFSQIAAPIGGLLQGIGALGNLREGRQY